MTRRAGPDGPLTLTHARLRAAQGDREAARRILEAFLEGRPDDADAAHLLNSLGDEPSSAAAPAEEGAEPERRPGDASRLASTFRAALRGPDDPSARRSRSLAVLRDWLRRIAHERR